MGIRYIQPQTPVGIDWSNPLARGISIASIPSNGVINLANPSESFSPNFDLGIGGIGRAIATSTTKSYSLPNSPNNRPNEFTAIVLCNATATLGAFRTPFAKDWNSGASPSFVTFGIEYNQAGAGQNVLTAFTSTNTNYSRTSNYTIPDARTPHLSGILRTASSVSAIFNGNIVATNTGISAVNYSGSGANDVWINSTYNKGDFNVYLALYWSRALSNAEIKALSDNPWQIFKSQSRRIWVAAAGGGDATATITGVSGSGQIGTLSTSGNASVSLTGASGTGSVGSVVASVSVATAITGVSGTGSVGTTTQTGSANVTAPSAAGTGSVGTVSASGSGSPDGNVTITGIAGTGQVGTLAASGNGAVSITGIAATGSVGSVTPSVTVTTTITGAIGTGSVGTTTQTGAANATVSSAVGIGLVGTVSATGTSQDGNAVISGISGIGSVGIVSANDGTVVNNHGFIIIDTEPRLWWKRKPSKLDDKKAEEKIFKVARVIERVVKHVANSNEPSVSKEVYRKAAYAEVAPLLREMPGFDWSPMFRAILTQSKLQEQNRIAAEQAGILAKQEIERIKRIRDDEEALIVLLMGA